MKRNLFFLFICALTFLIGKAQNVGINGSGAAAHSSALLDINSTDKGLLIPRVNLTGTSDVTTIASPATSLLVYNLASVSNVTPGFYYWNGVMWVRFDLNVNDWSLIGNAGTNPVSNFIGTTDVTDFVVRTSNAERMRVLANGLVGIGEVLPRDRLHVSNGNFRIGEVSPINTGTFPGSGRRIYFSGGPAGPNYDSENSDPLWMSRLNVASDATELRLNLSDNCSAVDAFVIQSGGSGCGVNSALFRFDGSGNAYKLGGGSWLALSDRRLKYNVQSYSLGLALLSQIHPVKFQYNGKGETRDNGEKYVGVIAQELAEIAPEMVNHDGEYLSVDPSAFTYILINSVQEQQGQIEIQKEEIKELQGENEKLAEEVVVMKSQLAEIRAYLSLEAKNKPSCEK